ncbi:phosphoserine phosphatase SerB [Cryobacterium sp. TMT1-21]|uniref:phosphoserine phosphatase n=1 Tax=Cryobacterium shii TaxID=1259235 RepID=A0AAQ2C6Q3_9MICO|nr:MULTISPECIES: phosphoserine phosphatase SerB [Cryobacterium]TFC48595.1 phosphoserine phosphatase SerB [Cryobacterium shii]TFC81804.1 phosphoserine phosphatase SerB [Cryobacterium sp. TmT2-59]TFD08290.1 phosphoserine phosphatase SerB [Cryobacterium sp. TMT1-21]TFD20668.1 phosphoserine phosphatase SerB [Cryobacterium sp. TMT4-10]TFD24682.1 phosphoserine phosphatase SerB [Cryobacterium sp. TMT2-23]
MTGPARFLVVLDADSTLIENEVIELLADAAGSLALVAEVTERAMLGEIDFAESLRERVRTLAGLPTGVFEEVGRLVRPTLGVPNLIAGLHSNGSLIGVVSGGFHEILDPLAETLGLDHWRANRLEVADGRLTGGLLGPIIDAAAKAATLREWAALECVALPQTVAVGDGANDLQMLHAAGLGIAFNAKPVVREQADLAIDIRDLSQVLPMLGLRG